MKAKLMEPLISVSAAVMAVVIGIEVQVLQSQGTQNAVARSGGGYMPPVTWKSQTDLASAEYNWGIFGAKGALVASNEIMLFYTIYDTFLSEPGRVEGGPTRSLPGISATACPQAGGTCFPINVTENKSLGWLPVQSDVATDATIKQYQLGVARLQWVDRPNHVIKVTANRSWEPGGSVNWTIEPLLQVGPKPNVPALSREFLVFRQGKPKQIAITVGSLGGTLNAAAIKLSVEPSAEIAPVYVQVDLQHEVSVMTEVEYAAYTTALPPEPAPFLPNPNAPPTPTTAPEQ